VGSRAVWNQYGRGDIKGYEGDLSWGASMVIKDEPFDCKG